MPLGCGDEREGTMQAELTAIFRRYGLPDRMLMDNAAPWGSDAEHRHTWLTVSLLKLGVAVSHGRSYHPQTQAIAAFPGRSSRLTTAPRRSCAGSTATAD